MARGRLPGNLALTFRELTPYDALFCDFPVTRPRADFFVILIFKPYGTAHKSLPPFMIMRVEKSTSSTSLSV